LNIYANDKGVPSKRTGPQIVTVNVVRNLLPPVFDRKSYTKTIKEDSSPGSEVLSVHATDKDQKVQSEIHLMQHLYMGHVQPLL